MTDVADETPRVTDKARRTTSAARHGPDVLTSATTSERDRHARVVPSLRAPEPTESVPARPCGTRDASAAACSREGGRTSGLRITGLAVEYGGRRTLTDVSLDVPGGGYTCVLGASGSGKTTLLSAIAGTLRPVAGRVEIDGHVLSDASTGVFVAPERRRLGMVFQDYLLWPHLTAIDNVALPLRHRDGRVGARARGLEWLVRVGLRGLEGRYPVELSGGQQQRVALARALAVEPRLVLLDEPLSALDAGTRAELRELLRRLAAQVGFGAVHVTHDATEALALGHHLVVMSNGRVVQTGSGEEVFTRPATREVAALTGAVSLAPIRVLARDVHAATVQLGDMRLRIAAPRDLHAGNDGWLVLRPHALTCRAEPRAIALRARLLDASYRGDRWEVEADVAHGARVSFWHDERPEPDFDVYLRPDRVWAVPW